jgi:hypothetical protein
MLCSWIHWPKNFIKNLFTEGYRFLKNDIFGWNLGAMAWVQWFLVLSPFAFHGWSGGWEHLWNHNAPVIFILFLAAFFSRSKSRRTSCGNDDD